MGELTASGTTEASTTATTRATTVSTATTATTSASSDSGISTSSSSSLTDINKTTTQTQQQSTLTTNKSNESEYKSSRDPERSRDLFGVQLEVTSLLLEAERRKLNVLQRELQIALEEGGSIKAKEHQRQELILAISLRSRNLICYSHKSCNGNDDQCPRDSPNGNEESEDKMNT